MTRAVARLSVAVALSTVRPDVPVPLRPLQRREIVDKLDAVPVFSVVNQQTQKVLPVEEEEDRVLCFFHLDVSEAKASLERLRRDNPGVQLTLSATPLGAAFALCEWDVSLSSDELKVDAHGEDAHPTQVEVARNVELRLHACQAETSAAASLLSEAPVPPLLRHRNKVNGALPLFGSDELRFSAEDGAEQGKSVLPIFFRRDDLRDAWLASGGKAEEMPVVLVTDLRTLAWQMQFDISQDWRPLLFIASESTVEYMSTRAPDAHTGSG